MNYFNKNLEFLLKKEKMTKVNLAEQLETSRQSMNRILEANNPTAKTLIKISDILKISIDDLLKKDLTTM